MKMISSKLITDFTLQRNYPELSMPSVVRRTITFCLSSLLVGSVGSLSAIATESATETARPLTYRELLETLNHRPVAPEAEVLSEPVLSEPVLSAPDEAIEAVPEANAAEQEVRLRLSLSDRKVYVYRGDTLEASYPVAIGRPGWETPTGEFEVFSQVVDPGWTNPITEEVVAPGPNNPLGDRWIAFWTDGLNSIGFHGTPDRDSVGQAASHGCIRMYNEDVRELYEMVALGTTVVVEP